MVFAGPPTPFAQFAFELMLFLLTSSLFSKNAIAFRPTRARTKQDSDHKLIIFDQFEKIIF